MVGTEQQLLLPQAQLTATFITNVASSCSLSTILFLSCLSTILLAISYDQVMDLVVMSHSNYSSGEGDVGVAARKSMAEAIWDKMAKVFI